MGGDVVLKPHVSGADCLETVLILQNKKVWYATLILSGMWGMPNTVSAMQWLFSPKGKAPEGIRQDRLQVKYTCQYDSIKGA